jgi:predicted nucleic acid-binding protein
MIVVSDTSPLDYLILIQQDHVLPALFGRVIAPPAVMAELQHPATPPAVRAWTANPPTWLEVRQPTTVSSTTRIGPGEAEAISLARELRADALLMDERKGLAIAQKMGLFVTGTLGVLEIAAEKGLTRLPDAIAALRLTSFRVSESLLEQALARDADRARVRERHPPPGQGPT